MFVINNKLKMIDSADTVTEALNLSMNSYQEIKEHFMLRFQQIDRELILHQNDNAEVQ